MLNLRTNKIGGAIMSNLEVTEYFKRNIDTMKDYDIESLLDSFKASLLETNLEIEYMEKELERRNKEKIS